MNSPCVVFQFGKVSDFGRSTEYCNFIVGIESDADHLSSNSIMTRSDAFRRVLIEVILH